jgi:hypothetical protein
MARLNKGQCKKCDKIENIEKTDKKELTFTSHNVIFLYMLI